ncbi:MAG: hypothetical protein R8G01_13360 [Ilumatobacteraceae bacterium]|nr:hypothetical protein [Ilumatobacteraceae bacterium]
MLVQLLDNTPYGSTYDDYERTVIEENVLGKETAEVRKRTFRSLRELYVLSNDRILFRALRDVWSDDPKGQPLLAGLCALATDSVFRSTAKVIISREPGDEVNRDELGEAAEEQFPGVYSASTIGKIGRNSYSSWQQTGHLDPADGQVKRRRRADATASTVAYALLLGHLEGVGGEALFHTEWAKVLDRPVPHLLELATLASQRSLIDFRHSAGVIEVGFSTLMRPMEGQLL